VTLVVLGAPDHEAAGAAGELWRRGPTAVEAEPVGRDRTILTATFADDAAAADAARGLRAGWAATVRPAGGGHLQAWLAYTRPVEAGERLWVCFPWSEFDRARAPLVVEIDPGPAFGAGRHPSTRLVLVELASRMAGGERVLDVGCGSGVLAVSAAALGAASVVAVDIDPSAVAATSANAARNGVDALVDARDTPVERIDGAFDVIVANIGARTLIDLAPAVVERLAPGGWIVLSGLSPAQASMVAAAYRPARLVATPGEDDWSALVLVAAGQPRAPSSVSTDGAK
jgi:ribosomal protein L11 methyltransferase